MHSICAIAFDVFGTLCHIKNPRSPFKQLLRHCPDQAARWLWKVMCEPLSLSEIAAALNIGLSPAELARLEDELRQELESIELFPDVAQTLEQLKESGLKLAVISKLPTPIL